MLGSPDPALASTDPPNPQIQPLAPGSEEHKGRLPEGLGHPFLSRFQHTRPTL